MTHLSSSQSSSSSLTLLLALRVLLAGDACRPFGVVGARLGGMIVLDVVARALDGRVSGRNGCQGWVRVSVCVSASRGDRLRHEEVSRGGIGRMVETIGLTRLRHEEQRVSKRISNTSLNWAIYA